jgi:hypothetical protein
MAFLTDLFVNFTQFPNSENVSVEGKFIKWKRFYDASSDPLNLPIDENLLEQYISTETQEISQQTDQRCDYEINLPSLPLELVSNNCQLPDDLIAIQNSADCYRNFKLETMNSGNQKQWCAATKTEQPEHAEQNVESEHVEQTHTKAVPQPKGKNINLLKDLYEQTIETPKRKKKETSKPRKRKRAPCETVTKNTPHHHRPLVPEDLPKMQP